MDYQKLKDRCYANSPFDLASDQDDAYRDGVDYALDLVKGLLASECECCGLELNDKEKQEASGHCFHCMKGNCEICGEEDDDL